MIEHVSTEPLAGDKSRSAGGEDVGASIGRYVLLERLGAGGMGVVFAAWDTKLERRVALKLISNRNPDLHRQLQARLKREAQAMARLRHPNVVSVYDSEEADGRLFITMEYIDGVSLRRWLQDPSRTGPEIVAAFRQAGEGLAAAHAQGVIHRDFKPDNVLIANDGRVLVLDFGLASWATSSSGVATQPSEPRARSGDDPGELEDDDPPSDEAARTSIEAPTIGSAGEQLATNNLTMPGAVLGTPAYIAPEQHRGQPIDARSDQFSFCAALWEALSGKLPFGRGPLVLARARTAKVGEWERRDVPTTVEKALRRGLAWSPDERWPDMRALLDALAPAKRKRRRWAAITVPAIAIVLGLAAAQLGNRTGRSHADLCDDAEARSSAVWNPGKANALALAFAGRGLQAQQSWPFLQAEIERWIASWVATDRDLCRRYGQFASIGGGVRQEQLACLDRQLGHVEQLIEVLATVSEAEIPKIFDLLVTLPSPQRCRELGSEPVRERERSEIDATELDELDSAIARAELELKLSRLDAVEQSSAALFEQTKAPGFEPQHVRVAKLRAELLVAQRRAPQALDVTIAGLEAAERSGDPLLRLDALLLVAKAHARASETIAADRWLRQARALAGELVLDRSARSQLAASEARVAMYDARFDEALAAWDRALAAMVPEQDRFEYIEWLHDRATVLFLDNKPSEGLEQLRRCEQMYESLVPKQHDKLLKLRMDIAHAQEKLEDFATSRASYLAVADDMEAVHGGPTDLSVACRTHAAALLAMLGDCEAARAEFDPLMELARELMAYPSAVLGNLLRRRTSLCGYATPDAVDYATQALALYREALTDEHASTAATHAELGIALLVAGDPAQAKLAAARALELFAIVDPEAKD
ncbi:MAG TPA: serine/threonine-protein kinase, partial [Enhygromyxa sp.]|nr:serine/threonine-protein kinase [Enhygromyxa sp.]